MRTRYEGYFLTGLGEMLDGVLLHAARMYVFIVSRLRIRGTLVGTIRAGSKVDRGDQSTILMCVFRVQGAGAIEPSDPENRKRVDDDLRKEWRL